DLRIEILALANHSNVHPVVAQFDQIVADESPKQTHQVANLGWRPRPVLRAEGKDSQDADAEIAGRTHAAPQRFDPAPVSFAARQSARGGPASVAVHDDGNVPGHGVIAELDVVQGLGIRHFSDTSYGEDLLLLGGEHLVDLSDDLVG